MTTSTTKTTASLNINGRRVNYAVSQRRGTRRLRLSVGAEGRVLVSAPPRLSWNYIERFVYEKADWIIKALDHFSTRPVTFLSRGSRADYLRYKEAARKLALERLEYFNTFYGFHYTQVSIRDQKTRWGSCSPTGSLSFNYRLALLPPHLADYLVVHELCHIGQMNHSPKFWKLVAKTIPHYAEYRIELKHLI